MSELSYGTEGAFDGSLCVGFPLQSSELRYRAMCGEMMHAGSVLIGS